MPRPILTTAAIGAVLAVALAGGCHRTTRPAGGSTVAKAEQARKQAETMAANVAAGVANAQSRAIPELARSGGRFFVIAPGVSGQSFAKPPSIGPLPSGPGNGDRPAPKSPPRPGSPAVIKERVSSSVCTKESEAEEDALSNACSAIERKLAELDPPVHYRPTLNEARNEFARRDSRTVHPPGKEFIEEYERQSKTDKSLDSKLVDKLVCVDYDVEVTSDQVRELRTRDRVAGSLRVVGGLVFVALAVFLFLRLDEWTKGYLTTYLAGAAVVMIGGAVAALYFV